MLLIDILTYIFYYVFSMVLCLYMAVFAVTVLNP